MGELLFLMFIGVPYILYRLLKDEFGGRNNVPSQLQQDDVVKNKEETKEEIAQRDEQTIKFLTDSILTKYPFEGLADSVKACVANGWLVNRSNSDVYDVISNTKSIDIERCVSMLIQDKIWEMNLYFDFDNRLPISESKIADPDTDLTNVPLVKRYTIIRYILAKNHWSDEYIRKYMLDSRLGKYISPEYFDEYFERVKDCLDQYPFDYFCAEKN